MVFTTDSNQNATDTLTITGIRVQPTTGVGLGSANVTVASSGTVNGGFSSTTVATLTKTAGAASRLSFGVQPVETTAFLSISPAVTVQILDQFGNFTTGTNSVVMTIGNNPSSGTLGGTRTNAAVGGTATFNNLSIDVSGVGYTFSANSSGLTGTNSTAFNITAPDPDLPGPPTNIVTIAAGAYVIPMDNTNQSIIAPFNLKAYGLINRLLQNNIPVKWAIRAGKAKDAADFTALAYRFFPSISTTTSVFFAGGPFIVDVAYTNLAYQIITNFGNSVAVYKLMTNTPVDIRYTIGFKPHLAVNTVNDSIHTDLFDFAGITNYTTIADASLLANSCYTCFYEPHNGNTNGVAAVRAYLETGGNFVGECLAIDTYENATAGRFQSTSNIVTDNIGNTLAYSNADLAFSQFMGVIDPAPGGSHQDWTMGGGSFINHAHVLLDNAPGGSVPPAHYAASSSKLINGQGGMVFYLGGHNYGAGGSDITLINGQRMILNTIFVPMSRPACGFDFVADVGVGKSGAASILATSNLVYTISVTNFGPAKATNVVASDVLPTNVVFVSASSGGTNNAGVVSWTLGTLAIGAVTNVTLTVSPPANGSISNIATVTSSTTDLISTNNTSSPLITSVTPVADAAITKTGNATVTAGQNVTYTILVTNLGPSTATNVVVSDPVPAGTSFVSATGGGTTNGSGIVIWPAIANLLSGGSASYTLTVNTLFKGMVTNVASLSSPVSDPNSTNNITLPVLTDVQNRQPVASNQNVTTPEDTSTNIVLTGSDADGDSLTFTILTAPTNGVISGFNTNTGALIYTLGTNYFGSDSFTFLVNDGVTNSAAATVTVTVTSVNDVPVAVNDVGSTPKNTQITVSPLANDSDLEGNPLTVISVSPTNGVASIIGGTNVLFTPATNFLGTATISYTISDGHGGSNTALITISVTNRPPTAVNDTVGGTNHLAQTINPLGNDSDPDNDALTITNAVAIGGTVSINPGGTNLTFTPTNVGAATINYTITDGSGGSSTSTITVNVVNLAPTLVDDTASSARNVAVTIPVLANDTDPNGDPLTLVSVTQTNGTASVNGTNVVFTPNGSYLGTSVLTYTVTDGQGGTNTALITITVTNRPPSAVNDTVGGTNNIAEMINPLGNDSDSDNDSLVITNASAVGGMVSINLGGTNLTFTPTNNGTATITYTINDGNGGSATATITVNIVNLAPTPANDAASSARSVAVTIPVLANDSDPNSDPLTLVSVTETNGTASVSGTNVVFTPNGSYLGTSLLTYTVTDGQGGTNTALITISVTNRPPTAANDTVGGTNNIAQTINPLANDSDPDNDALTITNAVAVGGIVNINPGGTNLTFTPTNNGTVTITYTINDGNGGSATATITVTVGNLAPTPANDTASSARSVAVTIPVLANDTDPNGDPLTLVSVTQTNGTASVNGTNVVFTPNGSYLGTSILTYTVTDGQGGTNSALITISVTNRPPGAANDTVGGTNHIAQVIDPLGNDSDSDNDALTITNAVTTGGIVSINPGGTNLTFTPTNNGTATITYTITDGNGGSATATITVTVVNLAPTPANDTASSARSVAVTIPVLANDTDPNGDPLTLVSVTQTNGTASVNGTNVVFTPNGSYLGTSVLTYTVTDGQGGTNTALITISVTNRPPVAVDDVFAGTNNLAQTIEPLGNDSDPDSDALTITNAVAVGGIASINPGGTNLTFTPTNNGTATITYTITDSNGGSSTATITVGVNNLPPTLANDSASTARTVPVTISVLANDSDPNGDVLTLVSVTQTNGTANVNGTNVLFTPNGAFVGTVVLTYTVTDSQGSTNTALITISVTNNPPAANNDSYTTLEDITLTASVSGVLTNDTDVDGDALNAMLVATTTNGVLTLNTNGSFTYTPNTNFNGTDSFTYYASDGSSNSAAATVNITITPVNDAPSFTLPAGPSSPVGATWTAHETNRAWYSIASSADGSKLAAAEFNGQIYTSTDSGATWTAQASGNHSWYSIASSADGSKLAAASVYGGQIYTSADSGVTWTARESNREWISIASSADGSKLVAADYGGQIYTSTDFGLTWTVQVGSGFHFWYSIASSADGNKLAAVDNGGLIYTSTDLGVTWTAQASGSRSWVSIASSADGNKLAAVNDGGQIYTSTDSGVTWTARENNHNWTSITSSTDGDKLAAVDNSGQIYTSVGSTLPYIITVPANSGLYTVSSFATNILAGPPDEATQTVSFTVTNDNNAIFSVSPTIAANGTLSFSPSALPGTAIITVVAQDNGGKANGGADTSAPQTFTITITNNAPVANDDFAVTSVNTPVTINATANDTDPNGDSLTIVSVSPTNGTASIVNGTKVLFTPNINFNGTATIGYTVSDGNGGTASALITVSISAVADVAVKKSGPANVYAGTNFDYTITVTNLGASTASSLSVTDDLPAGVTFMSSTAGATVNGSQVVWTNLGDLATGSSTNLIITVTAPANGTSLTNVASGRSPTADPNPTNNVTPPVVTTVTSVADVSVTKNAQTAAVLPGAAFDYTITVSNAGPSTASSVTVTDDLPANVTFVSASGRRTSRSS